MSRKSVLLVLFLLICLVVPSPAGAQSSFKISNEFLGKTLGDSNQLDMDLCGNLEITGGTGWLYIELTLSSYYHFYNRIHAAYGGKDVLDSVFVDCGPYYLGDIMIDVGSVSEPSPAVEGQPIKYRFKAKLGRNLKPFVMKICRGAMGYWYNSLKFIQLAQAVRLEAHWVAGDKEPENPLGSSQTTHDPLPNLNGNDWSYGPTTRVSVVQQGASITINSFVTDHGTSGPHYQITGTIQGNKITGTWRWIGTTKFSGDRRFSEARCLSGSITAEIASDGRSLRIVNVEDPCGHGWSGVVIRR